LAGCDEVAIQESINVEVAGIRLGARDPNLPHPEGVAALVPTLAVVFVVVAVVLFLVVLIVLAFVFPCQPLPLPAAIAQHAFYCVILLTGTFLVVLLGVPAGSREGELTLTPTVVGVGEVVLLVANLELELAAVAGVVLAGHAEVEVGIFTGTPRPVGDEEVPHLVGIEEVARVDPGLLILVGLLDADAPGVVDVVVEGADAEVVGVAEGDGLAGGGVAIAEGDHLAHLGEVVLLVEGVEGDAEELVPAAVVLPAGGVASDDVHVLPPNDLRPSVREKMAVLIIGMVLGIDLVHPYYIVGCRFAIKVVDAAIHVNLAVGAKGLAAGIGMSLVQGSLDHFICQFLPVKIKVLALEVGHVGVDLVVVEEESTSILLHPTAVRSQLPSLVALSETTLSVPHPIGRDKTIRRNSHSRRGQYRHQ